MSAVALGTPSARSLAAYGCLGLPLAMAALPVYVHVPKLYGDTLGVPLATVGAWLLAVRAWDAVQDPLLGWWSDARRGRRGGRWLFVAAGGPLLVLGMLALFRPATTSISLAAWMGASLMLVYTAYSLVTVSYQAIGAELSRDPQGRTRVTAWREGFALAGVLAGSALPEWLRRAGDDRAAFAAYSAMFAPLLLAGVAVAILGSPRVATPARIAAPLSPWLPLRNARFRVLALAFVLGGVAAAIPATLVLFFVEDVLRAREHAAAFLVAYFAAGAAGLPAWVALARRWGKARAWQASMALAIAAFAWASQLGAGDVAAFFAICAMSGLALGADLALPAAMLADVIDDDERRGLGRQEGAYFGFWNLLAKANLALAAGIALPALGMLGYAPHATDPGALRSLALVYALLPCALKACAAWSLATFDHASQGRPS